MSAVPWVVETKYAGYWDPCQCACQDSQPKRYPLLCLGLQCPACRVRIDAHSRGALPTLQQAATGSLMCAFCGITAYIRADSIPWYAALVQTLLRQAEDEAKAARLEAERKRLAAEREA